MIEKIDHVMMWASDLERTAAWYKEKLGFSIAYHAPNEFLSLQHEKMGRIDFHAAGSDKSNVGRGPLPYFVVRDIIAVKKWLESKEIRVHDIQQEASSPRHTWFWDCEGNILGLEEF